MLLLLLLLLLFALEISDIGRNFQRSFPLHKEREGRGGCVIFLGNLCDSERRSESRREVRWNNNENHPGGLKAGDYFAARATYLNRNVRPEKRFPDTGRNTNYMWRTRCNQIPPTTPWSFRYYVYLAVYLIFLHFNEPLLCIPRVHVRELLIGSMKPFYNKFIFTAEIYTNNLQRQKCCLHFERSIIIVILRYTSHYFIFYYLSFICYHFTNDE